MNTMLKFLKPLSYIFNKINTGVKRVIIVVAVFVTIFQLFFYFMNKDKFIVNADNNQKRNELYEFVNDPSYQKSEQGKIAIAAYRVFLCYSLGETCTDNPNEAEEYYEMSMINKVGTIFTYPLAHPPASGVMWVYDSLQQSGFVPNTYAQGIGFYALQPLAPIWKMFRNVSYMILVFIIVAIGFMIMFRGQINPQMEIGITNVLPRIVMTILLITFSFAIAGFLIDFMYVVMGLGASIIATNFPGAIFADQNQQVDIMGNAGWLFHNVVANGDIWASGGALLSLVPQGLQTLLRTVITIVTIPALGALNPKVQTLIKGEMFKSIPGVGSFLGAITGTLIGRILFTLISGILFPLILSLIVYVTALFLFFRIFFLLLTTYIKILLSIIFSPIVLLFEAFPGRSTFGFWFKGLFFNLMTFPIVTILIMVSGLIVNIGADSGFNYANDLIRLDTWNELTNSQTLWAPPFLYSAHGQGFTVLVGLSILFIIPDIVAFIKKSMGVEDLPFNVTPGTLLGGAAVVAGGVGGLVMRSRALTREFGLYRDANSDTTGFGGFISKVFQAKDPYSQPQRKEYQSTTDNNS